MSNKQSQEFQKKEPYKKPNKEQQEPYKKPNKEQQEPYKKPNKEQQEPYKKHNKEQQEPYKKQNKEQQEQYKKQNKEQQEQYKKQNKEPQEQYKKQNKETEKKNITKEILNKKVNINILQSMNIKNELVNNKVINRYVKYFVPKYYQKPKIFCNDSDKCKLSKKNLCQAISENFIVRNNIIAAILTTIPYKNSNGHYEGGICFQKYLKLNECKVCVPYDYKDLRNKDINTILTKILDKADYLEKDKCNENKGVYLELTDIQKLLLKEKVINISEKDIVNYPEIKYNYFFIKFTEKLQNYYFNSLTSLIQILEELKGTPIINNTTLNLISEKTKDIINQMYNTCHYYYIYGIISLINSDIKEENYDLENIISTALKK